MKKFIPEQPSFWNRIKTFLVIKYHKMVSKFSYSYYKAIISNKIPLAGYVNPPNLPDKLPLHSLINDKVGLPSLYHHEKKHDDLGKLLQLIAYYKPNTVLELGTSYGNTTANIVKHFDTHIYTVNALPEQISGKIITGILSKNEIGEIYKKYGYNDKITQLYENTLTMNLGKYITKGTIELAIIDACHDYAYILNDFNKIQPYLAVNAIVLLHDTHPSCEGHLLNSYRACLTLREQGFNIKHIKNTWWGIWIKK